MTSLLVDAIRACRHARAAIARRDLVWALMRLTEANRCHAYEIACRRATPLSLERVARAIRTTTVGLHEALRAQRELLTVAEMALERLAVGVAAVPDRTRRGGTC